MSTLIGLVAYAKAVGLTREEATRLAEILHDEAMPLTVNMAWEQLEAATDQIRRERQHPEQ